MSADELSAYKVQQSSGLQLKILYAEGKFDPNQTLETHGTRFTVERIIVLMFIVLVFFLSFSMLEIRIWIRICMFLGVPDPDPLVRGLDPDPDSSVSHTGVERTERLRAK
jgi:hypothetical protein